MEPEETPAMSSPAQDHYSEFRLDPLTERWALIAEGRGKRPSNITTRVVQSSESLVSGSGLSAAPSSDDCVDPNCAFCPGSERITTESVAIMAQKDPLGDPSRADDYVALTRELDGDLSGRRWLARVIENKYPAFRLRENPDPRTFSELRERFASGSLPSSARFFQNIDASGRHEVIVDVRRHIRGWGETTELEICLAFRLLQSRLRELRASNRFAYAFFFKNVGVNAGASQPHSHCQLTANATIPDDVWSQLSRVARYERVRRAAGEKESFFDALLHAELDAKKRVVAADSRFVFYCPYASRFPMQSEICPRFDGAFEDYGSGELDALALITRSAVRALQLSREKTAPDDPTPVDYNIVMTNAPYAAEGELCDASRVFRPRITVLPSLVKKAGYEHGSGIDINPVAPETAALLYGDSFGL